MPLALNDLLKTLVEQGGSALHLSVNSPPMLRLDGELRSVDHPPLTVGEAKSLLYSILTDAQKERLESRYQLDFSFGIKGVGRFRATAFHQKGAVGGVFRRIPAVTPTLADLGLPAAVAELADKERGLVLVTGARMSGRTTTAAALLSAVNSRRAGHILTLEEPIEHLLPNQRCLVTQRGIPDDSPTWQDAFRSALTSDVDVLYVSELRDSETTRWALRFAELGSLVVTTLLARSACQALNQLVDLLPSELQPWALAQLSELLVGVVCLVPVARVDRGPLPAIELLIPDARDRELMREDRLKELHRRLQEGGSALGSVSLNRSLAGLCESGRVRREDAVAVTPDPAGLERLLAGRKRRRYLPALFSRR